MEDEKEPVCHFNRQVVKVRRKRSLSQDRSEEGTFVPSKRRALSEEAPRPSKLDWGERRDLSSKNCNNMSEPRLLSAKQSSGAEGQQPDVAVGPDCSPSSNPVPAITNSGDNSQADIRASSTLHDQPAEMSSPPPTKLMGTSTLPARRPVGEAPPQQIDTVDGLDVGSLPVDAPLPRPQSVDDVDMESKGADEQHVDAEPPAAVVLPPHHYSAVREPIGRDRAHSAFQALLCPSPSPSTQRSDIQLQPPALTQDSAVHYQQPQLSRSDPHTLPKPEASRLPPMGTFRSPPALRPPKGQWPAPQPEARNRPPSDRAVFRLPTVGRQNEEIGAYAKGKTTTTTTAPKKRRQSQLALSAEKGGRGDDVQLAANVPKKQRRNECPPTKKETATATAASKKRRQSQVFPSGEEESRESTSPKGKVLKRQRRDDKPTDTMTDAVQVDGIDVQAFHLKRQQSRWTAINTVCLEKLHGDEAVDRVAAAISVFHFTTSQSQITSSSGSSQQQQQSSDGNLDNEDNDNSNGTHGPQQTRKTQEEEEEQFYHDHARRLTRDYGRVMTTPKKHSCNSPSKSKNSHDKGAVWAAFVEPLVREDEEHNLQLKERLEQRRRARKEPIEAQRRVEMQEEKRRVAREKARERRQRKKEEKAKEREEQEEMQDQPVDGVEGTSCSPDWLRLDRGST